ncbi:GAF domain-like protein [Choiromyces venosus 120613-1]|uniref:GAF domain-like protein n=1 Tax=Choiromyces venosus 120613-1 TaxID=1336337 RepID=A0A3N4ISU7_9PEZI|nr:GAF domain-like protein [Choiromyces venosus 120613-1]
MVHADASNFTEGVTKAEAWEQVIESTEALLEDQRNWVCNLANTASLIWHALKSMPEPSNHANWAGFYVLDPTISKQLILGPFMGKVACQTIEFGRGVCGKAADSGETQLVQDVHNFPGHIACDGETKSEIVVPIKVGEKVVAVIDIDSTVPSAFDEEDKKALETLAKTLGPACDW